MTKRYYYRLNVQKCLSDSEFQGAQECIYLIGCLKIAFGYHKHYGTMSLAYPSVVDMKGYNFWCFISKITKKPLQSI